MNRDPFLDLFLHFFVPLSFGVLALVVFCLKILTQ